MRDDSMSRRDDLLRNAEAPSLLWRSLSYQTILAVSVLCRGFLFGLSKTEVHGLPKFLDLLKSRSDYKTRRRGLVTVSNHLSVLDDPMIWGVLPLSFAAYHGFMNHRWTLGSHDICFKSAFSSHFFTMGQTLPTHRNMHSKHGGLFQPTMTEAIRLLSKIDQNGLSWSPWSNLSRYNDSHYPSWPGDCIDPFSDISPAPSYPSAPNDVRYYLQPSRYACNSYSWVHIFPEGLTHQTTDQSLRYFKWGVSRLILEPAECPDVVPMFIEGTDQAMHESRGFPRFLPRPGKKITISIGERIDTEAVFGDLRKKWHQLVEDDLKAQGSSENSDLIVHRDADVGILSENLAYHPDAIELRKECTRRVREQILSIRRERGYPDEDPKCGRVETWAREGSASDTKKADGSFVGDT